MAGSCAGMAACLLTACTLISMVDSAVAAEPIASPPSAGLATPQSSGPAVAAPPVAAPGEVAKDTVVDLIIDDTVSSKTSKDGDQFHLHLAEPIVRDGKVIVPAGAHGMGEVIHAAPAGFAGKAGELIIAARYLDCGAVRLPLGHFRFGRTGQDNTNATLAVVIAIGLPGLFITGGNVVVQPGVSAHARVTADVILPSQTAPQAQSTQNGDTTP